MKRPLAAVVSCYAAGLFFGNFFTPPLTALFPISFLIFALAILLKKFRPYLLCVLLALAGWTNLVFHTAIISPNDLRTLIGGEAKIVSVRGVLTRAPQIKITERNGEESEHSVTQVQVSEIRFENNWRSALGEILVSTSAPLPADFFDGQSVEISGVISQPPLPLADGLFDARAYFATRGIFYQLKTSVTNDWQLWWGERPREPSSPPLTDRFLNWSKHTLALGLPDDNILRLLWAMTLGWRTAFTGDIGDPFLRAGTMTCVS
ncbi:MAG TPA: ComEC/Rec2 family competence protein [Verrucomicrobiae bacterium]|nr:ComEC/Rec2 family competence protein [Verrucomicrobiae bacterium]